jgi:XTP/dITP diphosphohydrolase
MNTRQTQLAAFGRLLDIMDDLREMSLGPTMQSLRHYTIEETYELGDAILDNDLVEVKKNLVI